MKRIAQADPEQLIGALVPAPILQPKPCPTPLPMLPVRRLPTEAEAQLLDMARLDRSGRLSARALVQALGWRPGHRVNIDLLHGMLLVTSAVDGRHAVGSRGDLAVPAPARRLCGMTPGASVVLASYPPLDLVVVHPMCTVARLIHELHTRLATDDAG